MFTWIQRYFQRHFGIIFALILVAMAIPMVVIFAPSSGIGQGDKKIATREVFGYNLGSQEDQARLFGDANLSAMLQLGYTGLNEGQLQQYAFQRAAALHLAKELHFQPVQNLKSQISLRGCGPSRPKKANSMPSGIMHFETP